jgi:tetratricopeptide (TPR) repeat protein/predicted Ser/Thr protein kinase
VQPFLEDLGRFEIRRPLGSGGIGVVYEAIDRESGATVAIKTLHDVTPDALYRLKREFRLLQGLDHPNVCQHYELLEVDGRWFISMECVRGEQLLQAVRDDYGDYDEDRLRDALGQLAEALCALHNAGLVHRDLKPSNVLVEPTGRVVLLDFGFAEVDVTAGDKTRSGSIVGTPAYMAPEQAVHSNVGPAADWYSFGVILFELLTKRLPHDGETALAVMLAKQREDAVRPSTIAPDVPPDLDALCIELLHSEPGRRPTGESVLRRLGKRGASRDSRTALATPPSLAAAFVGRTEELTTLRDSLASLDRDRAVSVLVAGPSGLGKTSLVRKFSDEVVANGGLVFAGRCYERESVPYKAFDSVVDALARYLRRLPETELAALLPRHPELLVRMFPVLGGVPALGSPGMRAAVAQPHEQRNQAFAALRDMLERIARRQPLVITIDDWQWADADSVLLARDLVRHRDSPPLLLVLTMRPAEGADAAARIEAVTTPDSRQIDLGALVEAQAIQLVGHLRRFFAPSLDIDLAAIARETQGHPLYISELVRYVATKGRGADSAADQPVRLDEAILARIAALPIEARAIMDVLAVAGEPLPFDVLRDAVDLEPAIVQRHTAMLRVAHLVRSANVDGALEPYHDRVSEAVLASLTDKQRLAWHKRIIYAIEASPLARVRPELLLRHLDVAGESGRAAEIAIAAAQRAAAAGAFEQAASSYGLALRSGDFDSRTERDLQIEMAQALANAGRGLEAAQVFLDAAATADPATRMMCHRQAAEELLMGGEIERGLEILSKVLANVGVKIPSTHQRALASVVWSRIKLRVRGLGWKEHRETEIAPEMLQRLDVLKAASHSLAIVDTVRSADFNARWLLLALKIGEPLRVIAALVTEAAHQSTMGGRGVVRARELSERVRELAADSRDPRVRALVLFIEGVVEYWICKLERAEQMIREAERIFREEASGATSEHKSSRMFLMFTLRNAGSWARLRDIWQEYLEEAHRRGDRYVVTSMNRYCSSLWLAADDPAEARRTLAEAKWELPGKSFHTQHWFELEARSEIAIYDRTVERDLPDLEPLFALYDRSLAKRVVTVRVNTMFVRGRLALCRGDVRSARRFAAQLGQVPNPRGPAFRAMLEGGIAAFEQDDSAIAKLQRAIELCEAYELRLYASASRYQLGRLLGGTEGGEHLKAATRVMEAETVANPQRFADWFVPGLR